MTAETDLLPLPEWCQGCGESLPRDIARCNGAGRAECADCLRRTAPPGQWQAYIPPQSGPCAFRIGAKNERR